MCDIHCLDSVYLEDAGNETKSHSFVSDDMCVYDSIISLGSFVYSICISTFYSYNKLYDISEDFADN